MCNTKCATAMRLLELQEENGRLRHGLIMIAAYSGLAVYPDAEISSSQKQKISRELHKALDKK